MRPSIAGPHTAFLKIKKTEWQRDVLLRKVFELKNNILFTVDMLRYAQLDIFAFGQIRYVFAMLKLDML